MRGFHYITTRYLNIYLLTGLLILVLHNAAFPQFTTLREVKITSAKKKKYSNKNNQAVELIRQVIAHKKQNQPESYDYTEFRQYERMAFSSARHQNCRSGITICTGKQSLVIF